MCIICYLPPHHKLSEIEWENSVIHNPDGSGYMFFDRNDNIQVRRSMDGDQLYEQYMRDYYKNSDSAFIVHHRIGTHGDKSEMNLHPFRVNQSMAMCHNGILDWYVPKNSVKSDTLDFNDKVLRHLPHNFLNNKGMLKMIEEILGTGKMAFLDKRDRSVTILNERLGEWDSNRWFSNNTYRISPYETWMDMSDSWHGMKPTSNHKVTSISNTGESCDYCFTICAPDRIINLGIDSICYPCSREVMDLYDDMELSDTDLVYLLNKFADFSHENYEKIIDLVTEREVYGTLSM